MLPASQHAGFGDLSFNSRSHFNSSQIPASYPNPTKSELQLHNRNGGGGEEEEDEWAVYASSRVASHEKIRAGDLQLAPTHNMKPDNNVDEWGLFVASPVGGPTNHTTSSGVSSRKVENGGLQVGPSQNGEDWDNFISSPVASEPMANGSSLASSNNNSILGQRTNGGLQPGLTQNESWGFFSSNTGNTTEVTLTRQTSDQRDRIDDLQAGPSQKKILLEAEEEDDEWGTFVSTPVASQANNSDSNETRTSSFNEISQRKLGSFNLHVTPVDYEEEWGEFVSSPVASGTKTSVSNGNMASPSVKWEKPKGPIPLSFFGGEEEESVDEEIKVECSPNSRLFSVSHSNLLSGASPSISSEGVKEIIVNHYGGKENLELKNPPSPMINGNNCNQEATSTNSLDDLKNSSSSFESTSGKTEYGASRLDPFANGDNGVIEEVWDFQDASSDMSSSLTASVLKEDSTNSWASFSPLNGNSVSASDIGLKADILSPHTEPDHSEKMTTSPALLSNGKMTVHEAAQSDSSESTKMESILEFYRKLQKGSLLLVSHHVKGHKETTKVSSFRDQKVQGKRLDEEIQEAYRELKKLNVSEVYSLENTSRDSCINELLNITEEVYLKNFEREYQLSTKVLLAVEKLGPALDLLKHSHFAMNTLEMLSMEGINSYISTWYSLISVCSQELQNGASIWAQSISANLIDKLISSGKNYFIALGEIYRVVEILKLSLKRFNPLLLVSNQNRLSEVGLCLDMCAKAWSSGLNVALEKSSDGNGANALKAKSLAGSIKRIRELDIENGNFTKEKAVCKLCLLRLAILPEMKSDTWHGDGYIVKLANLWANKISSEPPSLPSFQTT